MSSISAIISTSALMNWIGPRKYKYIFVYSTISRHRDAKLKKKTCLPYVINIVTIDDLVTEWGKKIGMFYMDTDFPEILASHWKC